MKKLLVIISIFSVLSGIAQDKDIPFDKRLFEDRKVEFKAAVKDIKQGDYHFFDGNNADLQSALYHYLRAQEFNPHSSILNYKIGICYLYSNKKFNSLKYLKFAYKVNPDVDPNIKFYLAQAHQLNAEFDKAIELYSEHKDDIGRGDDIQRMYLNKKISECRTGKELKANPVRVWIDNLGDSVNTKYPEFSPVISADNRVLFFTGRRPDSKGDKTDLTGYHYEDVYTSRREFKGDWQNAENLGSPVNTKSHDATVGLAPDGKSLIVYRGINSKNGDLFITKEKEDGTWEEPKSLGENINTKHHESSASLSFDEKTLYFVSDQPGGFGQHDVYVAHWDEETKSWGEPQNLGSQINTEYEEKGVFFHPDGKTLYFSSEGHHNMGGLDVFKTIYDSETGEWSEPENLGYPINTPDDDIYFVVTGNERYAYYSSYRQDGFGEKDIYKITFIGPKKDPVLASADMVSLDVPLDKSPAIVSRFDDKRTDVITSTGTIDTEPDEDLLKMQNEINKLNNQINSYKNEIAELKEQLENNKNENNNNNNNNTSESDDEEINKLKDEIAQLKDEINQLSDQADNNTDNNNNTTERPEVFLLTGKVTDCKTKRGISANVSVTNSKTNEKVKDIITNDDGTYTVALEPGEEYGLTASGANYSIDSKAIKTNKKDVNTDKGVNFELCKVAKGDQFALRNIYFDFDKANLRISANNELDKLARLMKDKPSLKIELGGHTDRRGSDAYNLDLSRKRAEVAKDYLVRKGIAASRIKTKGYGESQPEVSGSEISAMSSRSEKEAAHQKNRRTIVTILSE